MATVSSTQLPALVAKVGYDVMLETYGTLPPPVYPSIFEMRTVTNEEGFSGRAIVGSTRPALTRRGEPAPARTMEEGYQWYAKIHKLQQLISIPEEMWSSPDAQALITARIRTQVPGLVRGFVDQKDQMAADLFNYGAYTAGRLDVFDGNFPGHLDPHPKFIYDGKPLFAASGNGHPCYLKPATTLVNHDTNTLTSSNLSSAYVQHTQTLGYNEAGEFVGGMAPDTLLVPPQLRETALILLNSTQVAGSSNNDININRGALTPVVWPKLTDTDGWFVGNKGMGLVCGDSGTPNILTSAPDPETGDVIVRLVSYFNVWAEQFRNWSAHRTAQS